MKILIIGATGLVGSHVLEISKNDDRISKIITLTRSPLENHPKLTSEIVDFNHLPEDKNLWAVDAIICTLGTTMKKAKTKEAFLKVDFEYPLKAAHLGLKNGVSHYILNSAKGANSKSLFFYNRVKGDIENALKDLSFRKLTIVRPGLIQGDRKEKRLAEDVASVVSNVINPILSKSFKPNHAKDIAQKMIDSLFESNEGTMMIESNEINS